MFIVSVTAVVQELLYTKKQRKILMCYVLQRSCDKYI